MSHARMPGDEAQPKPVFNATRAITIRARPEEIWLWLTQMGYMRAGCYGYATGLITTASPAPCRSYPSGSN